MSGIDDVIVLEDGQARLEILPGWGGGLRRYDFLTGSTPAPILRPDVSRRGMFALGCNVLLPFSNRISGGGFTHEGRFHPLAPNIEGNPFPVHGSAFQSTWQVERVEPKQAELTLNASGPGPFRYSASLSYALEQGALTMTLVTTNTGLQSLPFGVGFHPWFVRTARTTLQFGAKGYWSEDESHLPKSFHPISTGDFDFSSPHALPADWINSGFIDWSGSANIIWHERGLGVTVSADAPLSTLILYSPSETADFFCLEPVSHSVDAHNRVGANVSRPQILQPRESLTASMCVAPWTAQAFM